MVSTLFLSQKDRKTVRFIEKTRKNPQTVLRQMLKEGKRKDKLCVYCLSYDLVFPSSPQWCDNCVNKASNRYGKLVRILNRKVYIPEKECEHCHNKKDWMSQINILVCKKCLCKINKRAIESQIWTPPRFSLFKKIQALKTPKFCYNELKRAW